MMQQVLQQEKKNGTVCLVRRAEDIDDVQGLIIPGGESTTISRSLKQSGLYEKIIKRIQQQDISIMGTCAGCVLLASSLVTSDKDVHLLKAMDIQVQRNAFGRQKYSFEQDIAVEGFTEVFPAVFIRAPIIESAGKNVDVLAHYNKKIVVARQECFLALSFHPELTSDCRFHQYFLGMI
jgi:5'-phosphate synthase pdxT subunit